MEFSTSKKILLGIGLIITGLIVLSFNILDSVLALSLVNMGAIITIIAYSQKNKEVVQHDERTKMVSAKATSYSWMITMVIVSVLTLVNYYKVLTLSVEQTLAIILVMMNATFLGYKWWFDKKGI